MSDILSEIERQKRLEQARAWDAAEKQMAEQLVSKIIPDLAKRERLPRVIENLHNVESDIEGVNRIAFVRFCSEHGVRACPARPATVATFLLEHHLKSHDEKLCALSVITRMHDMHGLSNPCATALVRSVLESVLDEEPPRSWPKSEKEMFCFLPADIRAAIGRREKERDTALRRLQTETGELRQKLTAAELKSRKKSNESKATEHEETRPAGQSGEPSVATAG